MTDLSPAHGAPVPDRATRGWAGVYGAFTVLAVGAILSLSAWSDFRPASVAFISALGALTAVGYLATAYFLSNRLVISRSPGLVLLASAYIVCGFAVGVYTVTYPGVASQWWHFGPVASRWFWVLWHGAAAIGIIGFVALDDEWASRQGAELENAGARDVVARVFLRDAGAFMRGPMLLAVIVVVASSVLLWRDPVPFFGWFVRSSLPTPLVAILIFLDLLAIGLLAAALRRDHLVRAWLVLAAVASLLDVAASSWSAGQSTIGWYFAGACGLVAAVVLPIVLLADLRARLIAGEQQPLDPSFTDVQTGFANARGLSFQLGQFARLANVDRSPLTVAAVDVGETPNAPALLRRIFRSTDVIGHLREDEYAVVFTPGSKPAMSVLRRRLHAGEHVRIGMTQVDPRGPSSVGDLFADALRDARSDMVDVFGLGDASRRRIAI